MRIGAALVGLAIIGLVVAVAGRLEHGTARAGAVSAPVQSTPGSRLFYPAARPATLTLPDGQTRIVHSMLNMSDQMKFGDYVWDDDGVGAGPAWVRVDLARQTLSVFRAGHEIGTAVILFGADGKPTPTGVFPVLAKAVTHRSTLYDAEMPYMLRLTGDGVAIHASNVHEGLATHGCIGIPPAFARLLYAQIHIGDQVAIIAP